MVVLGAALTDRAGDADAAVDYRPPRVDQSRMVLRLTDLPPGFLNGYLGEGSGDDGLLCEPLERSPGKAGPVAAFARKYRPRGCMAAYVSYFKIPGERPVPPTIASGVMALGSAAAARNAWKLIPRLLSRAMWGAPPPRRVKTNVKIGRKTRLFHTTQARFPYLFRGKQRASFLVWQRGNTLATVAAAGASFELNDRAVAELAPRQQAHIRKPTRYTRTERFDAEVGFDDPAIDLPVYWLGRVFRPGDGLPPNRLYTAYYLGEPVPEEVLDLPGEPGASGEAPYPPLVVDYRNIDLEIWTPETWDVFAASRTSRAITAWKCTSTRTVALAEGSATIFGGYTEDYRRCPRKKPEAFTAWADLAGVKVVVNAPPAPDFIETVNPYGSFRGMEAILRGLRLRPKRWYQPEY